MTINTVLLKHFTQTAAEMRTAQKAWAKDRKVKDLDEAARKEAELDSLLPQIQSYINQLETNNFQTQIPF